MLPGGSPYGGQMYLPPAGGASPYSQPVPLSASPYQNAYYGQQPASAGLGLNGLTYDQQQAALSAPPGTVIIHTNSDSGRSRRHHHHHSRSRSRHRGSYD